MGNRSFFFRIPTLQLITEGYKVEGLVEDNIFEPGEKIIIKDLTVYNDGGMDLPEGMGNLDSIHNILSSSPSLFLRSIDCID